MNDRLREWLDDLREHWDDPYWRADHPEVNALIIAIITGAIGLVFAFLETALVQWRLSDG